MVRKPRAREAEARESRVRVFSYDESRFGLIGVQRRRITLAGVKPVGRYQYQFDSYYLYAAVEPLTGESFILEMPYLNSECFQVYLEEFSKAYSESENILVLDNGKFHKAKGLVFPENIHLEFLPPYAPELNPIERFWQELKARIAWEIFDRLEDLKQRVAKLLKGYVGEVLKSLTAYPYFMKAVQGLFP